MTAREPLYVMWRQRDGVWVPLTPPQWQAQALGEATRRSVAARERGLSDVFTVLPEGARP